jgi:predicted AlkP superfamily phosphohydrolase/phosphomutase
MRWIGLLLAIASTGSSLAGCQKKVPVPLVVVIELDGAGLDFVNELRAEGRLPNFDRLMASGASGPLQSWPSPRVMRQSGRRSLASPILWTSIATGKVPEKHGVRDFVLPVPGTASAWIGSEEGSARGEIVLPEIGGEPPHGLRLKLHSYAAVGEQQVGVFWNGKRLDTLDVPVDWTALTVPVPASGQRRAQSRLRLVFEKQSRPSHHGASSDRRRLAGEIAFVEVFDSTGKTILSLDPAVDREHFESGFYPPQGELTEIQSLHWRAKPVWTLLGEAGVPVGIIGHWGTWPAYPVNGFLVSSRMGVRQTRRGGDRLTWPDALAGEIEPLAPLVDDLEPTFERLHLARCEPRLIDRFSVLKKILIQDEYYVRLARRLFASRDRGLYTVYLRSIDVAAHVTLPWRQGAPIPEGCPDAVRGIMDEVYVQIDRWIGDILDSLSSEANVFVVSDHGMQNVQDTGNHSPFGLFIANGDAIRQGHGLFGSTVLDVAPTLLQIFDQPVPLDMDGKVLASIFEDSWLRASPIRYVDADTSLSPDLAIETDASEEALEELRALGYIE